jgi:hypothetical protein
MPSVPKKKDAIKPQSLTGHYPADIGPRSLSLPNPKYFLFHLLAHV